MRRIGAMRWGGRLAAALLPALLGACEALEDGGPTGPGGSAPPPPTSFAAEYEWILDGWEPGGLRPVGGPAALLSWRLPAGWAGEPFQVYARGAGQGEYRLIATVTSCAEGVCRYVDTNVEPGRTYDYFAATGEDRPGPESSSTAAQVRIPSLAAVPTPAAPRAVALDGAVYLRWASTGAERYRIFLERAGTETMLVEIGETDGLSFLDERAENGTTYSYRIAAIDTTGQFSARSALGGATPRPDYHSELIWAMADSAAASGFRFQRAPSDAPIVAGTAPSAQWRLEVLDGALVIRPLGQTTVTGGEFTTALTCGPGSDPDCVSIDAAPAAAAFSSAPATVGAGNTYVFRVAGDDGRTHYGKVRVQGQTTDRAGRRLVVFNWAYQLLPDTPSLAR